LHGSATLPKDKVHENSKTRKEIACFYSENGVLVLPSMHHFAPLLRGVGDAVRPSPL